MYLPEKDTYMNTVKPVIEAAASNYFHEIFGQDLLSKKWVLLRLLFEGGFYLRAASNTGFTVFWNVIHDKISFEGGNQYLS